MTNTQKDALSVVSELNLTILELIKDSDRLVLENQRLKNELDKLHNNISNHKSNENNDSLKEFLNRFLNPEDLGYAVSAYIRDEVRVALGYERVESNRYKY